MEFGMLIWNPITEKYSDALENIQRSFLMYMYYKTFQHYPADSSYKELLTGFEMDSLKNRREMALLDLPYALIRGHTIGDMLLQEVRLRVSRTYYTRPKETFYIPQGRTRLQQHSVINRAYALYNEIESRREIEVIDVFHQSRKEYKNLLREIIVTQQYSRYLFVCSSCGCCSNPQETKIDTPHLGN